MAARTPPDDLDGAAQSQVTIPAPVMAMLWSHLLNCGDCVGHLFGHQQWTGEPVPSDASVSGYQVHTRQRLVVTGTWLPHDVDPLGPLPPDQLADHVLRTLVHARQPVPGRAQGPDRAGPADLGGVVPGVARRRGGPDRQRPGNWRTPWAPHSRPGGRRTCAPASPGTS